MRSPLKVLLITASLVAASLGVAASAAATPAPPTLITSNFACSNGVCEVGPGNVGMPFGAGLDGTGSTCSPCNGNSFLISVVSGSLPPGLHLGNQFDNEWIISGTPTTAGTYAFTVQITPQPNNLGQPAGTSGTQQLTITVGTGQSDRPVVRAGYNRHQDILRIQGYDANVSALWSLFVTKKGKAVAIFSNEPNLSTADDGFLNLPHSGNDPCGVLNSCNLTVTNSLGSSVTVTLGPASF